MMEELREITREAKAKGLAVIVWSYPRGGKVTDETALDIVAYAAHMAALMGANIIKVKPPKDMLDLAEAKKVYEEAGVDGSTLTKRIQHIMQVAFAGRRLVVFSGGEATSTASFLDVVREIRDGGGSGSIVGRNAFRRPKAQALELLDEICKIYLGEA
jgi:class I fructose-bisphosphate aldolase